MTTPLQYLLITTFLIIISYNCPITFDHIRHQETFLTQPKITENDLKPLHNLLKNVHIAGYYTDHSNPDPEFDHSFQFNFAQINSALVPTILDRDHPLEHQYIVVYLEDIQTPGTILQHLPLTKIIAKAGKHILLLKQNHL